MAAAKRRNRRNSDIGRDEVPPTAAQRHSRIVVPVDWDVFGSDQRIAWIADRQDGLITRVQLLAAGLTRHEIDARIRQGRLHPVFRGVYSVGHRLLPPLGELRAANLAYGERSLITARSATHIWGLTRADGVIHVLLVGTQRRRRPGIELHRTATLAERDVRTKDGIRVTAPARSLIELAETASTHELERALNEARVLHLLDDPELQQAIGRAGRRHGAAKLRALVEGEAGPHFTRSELERRMRELTRRAGLPQPITNEDLLGKEVDFFWPEQRLVVETDGWQAHRTPRAFERDRRRDAELVARGYRVIRFTWRQLRDEPEYVVATLAAALAA
jgi:very-short-patch-repair endonuclease